MKEMNEMNEQSAKTLAMPRLRQEAELTQVGG